MKVASTSAEQARSARRSNKLRGACVGALLLLMAMGWTPAVRSGFYCEDPTIAHRFSGDTVSVTLLNFVSLAAPLLATWVVEARCCAGGVVSGVRHAWLWYREYLLGLGLVLLAADVAKLAVAEPRPHFLDTCRPDVTLAPGGCTAAASPTGYVSSYTCTSTEHSYQIIKDSTKSFPSCHAAFSVYSALFIVVLVQRRAPGGRARLALQPASVAWAAGCSLSRLWDRRHHAHDVAAGAVLGAAAALLVINYFCGNFWPGQCAARLQDEVVTPPQQQGVCRQGGQGLGDEKAPESGHRTVTARRSGLYRAGNHLYQH